MQVSEPSAPPSTANPTYTVQRRDTLWAIAERYLRDPLRYPEIVALNAGVVGPDNEIYPGTVLTLPADATGLPTMAVGTLDVTVEPGDSLSGIVENLSGSQAWQPAWQLNAGRHEPDGATFDDPDLIRPGWTLSIPVPTSAEHDETPAPAGPDQRSTPGSTAPHGGPEVTTTPEPTAVPTQPPATPTAEVPAPVGTPAPSNVHAPPSAANHATADSDHEAAGSSAAVFAAGGGLALAAGTLSVLLAYRRRQQRHRRPGRVVAGSPATTASMERELRGVGGPQRLRVDVLHELLLDLADACSGRGLPEVTAVRFAASDVTLLLADPDPDSPTGWVASEDGRRWTTTLDVDTYHGRTDRLPPFPLLVSIGHEESGATWLLNLERHRELRLWGDTARCVDLARFIAAELAHNLWAELVEITLVGIGAELVQINPDRLRHFDRSEPWPRDATGEPWIHQVMVSATGEMSSSAYLPGASVVMVCQDAGPTGDGDVSVSRDGILVLPLLGVELVAERLPADEAAVIADLLASAANFDDEPTPESHGDRDWDAHIDAGGVPLVQPAHDDCDQLLGVHAVRDDTRDALLPLAPSAYEAVAATSEQGVLALAPCVPAGVRADILDADPNLDADVRDWFAEECPRPRIGVLGPITVRCTGRLPERSPQAALHTEAAVFLALHPGGVAPHAFAEAMWPHDPDAAGKSKVHAAITRLRKWLGRDPETGREYLPSNADDPWNAKYVIENVLVDAELFRRLRARGLASGEAGIGDLDRALALVTGPPFHNAHTPRAIGPGGYGWLTEGNARLDNEYIAMIVDTAHTVATFYLAARMPERAVEAAQVARSTGSYDDTPLLDLVKASLDLGRDAEADAWIQQILTNNDAEVEEDLPPRTAEILFRLQKQWRERASATG